VDEKHVVRGIQDWTVIGVLLDIGGAGISGEPAGVRSDWAELRLTQPANTPIFER